MDTMADLLLILLHLSALYTALGLLDAAVAGITRPLIAWRRWRLAPSIQRRPRRSHPRRRIDRDDPGALRRPVTSSLRCPLAKERLAFTGARTTVP